MKLRIQTLTGLTAEVEADPQNTILDLKKVIYRHMDVTGVIRVIKGQKILPDGSTLEEHGLIDGSTINIVIKPDKKIKLYVKFGPENVRCVVSNSARVCDLKQQLIDDGIVGYELDEFSLLVSADDNQAITEGIYLDDDSLPLHTYGVSDNTSIRVSSKSMMIQFVNPYGLKFYYTFSKEMKINQVKEQLLAVNGFFTREIYYRNVDYITFRMGIIFFLQSRNGYRKLDGKAVIGDTLSANDVIYCIEDTFIPEDMMISVNCSGDRKGCDEIGRVGWMFMETVLTLKLRVQHQLGFPVSFVDVKKETMMSSLNNDEQLDHSRHNSCSTKIRISATDSVLEVLRTTDDSTNNIDKKSEKQIKLCIKLGPREVMCSMRDSVRMRDLKQHLIDGGAVGYELDEFSFLASADDNDGITEDIFLNDDSLPLQLGRASDITTLRIISRSIMIQFVNPRGQKFWSNFPKAMTIKQLKEQIRSTDGLFDPGTAFRMGFIFFLGTGSGYRKLQCEASIGATLSDNDVICCTEDVFFSQKEMIPVHYNGGPQEIGRVGCGINESVLSLKLRVQHQLGFPVSCVDVREGWSPLAHKVQISRKPTDINVC